MVDVQTVRVSMSGLFVHIPKTREININFILKHVLPDVIRNTNLNQHNDSTKLVKEINNSYYKF